MQKQQFEQSISLNQEALENPNLLLHEYWLKWKKFIRYTHRQRQIETLIMSMHSRKQQKTSKLAFTILKDYSNYRIDKRMRNIEVYRFRERKLESKSIKGLCIYTKQLRNFQSNLQEIYCKWIYQKYFNQILKFKKKGLKNQHIRLEMFSNKVNSIKLRKCFDQWKKYAANLNEFKQHAQQIINNLVKILERDFLRNSFGQIINYSSALKQTNKHIHPVIPPIQRNTNQQVNSDIFQFKRKYAPIKDISRRISDRTPEKKCTPASKPFRNTMQDFNQGGSQKKNISRNLRIIISLIQIKEAQIAWLSDPVFDKDILYDSFRSKLRLELGHYLQIQHDIQSQQL